MAMRMARGMKMRKGKGMGMGIRMRVGKCQRLGEKENEQRARELQFSRHLFLRHATRFAVIIRTKEGGKKEKTPTEKATRKSRAFSVRGKNKMRGAQCGVSGPSNACKQSQKTTTTTTAMTTMIKSRMKRRRGAMEYECVYNNNNNNMAIT